MSDHSEIKGHITNSEDFSLLEMLITEEIVIY
jgi:hypothetical protein